MIISTDIETYERREDGYLYPILDANQYCIGVVLRETGISKTFYDPKEHLKEILELGERMNKRKEKLYVYGHNHLYDFIGYGKELIFKKELKKIREYPLLFIMDNIYFLDTMSFYRMSLEDMGKQIGMKKGIMPERVEEGGSIVTGKHIYCPL